MPRSVIVDASPDLIREAAQQRGWAQVLRQLGLNATDDNVCAFRVRAVELGIDVSHLRRQWGLDDSSSDVLREAARDATTLAQVVARLGLQPGGATYAAVIRVAALHGIDLPERQPYGLGSRSMAFRRTDDEVRASYHDARSIADLLRRLGLVPRGDNYRVIKARLQELGLDPAKLPGQSWSRGAALPRIPIEELLVRGRPCSGTNLTRRLIEAGLLPRRCALCDLDEWLGQLIPLELDHINGEHDDNRLENLRLLCPNCHALTDTYRGRNIKRRRSLPMSPEC